MRSLLLNRHVLGGVLVVALAFGLIQSYDRWHNEPVRKLEHQLKVTGTALNIAERDKDNLSIDLVKCTMDLNTTYYNGYNRGKHDTINNTDYTNPNPFTL